jgi:hypothetical protein
MGQGGAVQRIARRFGPWIAAAFAVTLIVIAGYIATGSESGDVVVEQNPGVQALIPERGSEILQQDRVGADLSPGYDGALAINGVEIPDAQLATDRREDLNYIVFQPGEGRVLEQLDAETNCAEVIVWRIADGPERASAPLRWCFEVL